MSAGDEFDPSELGDDTYSGYEELDPDAEHGELSAQELADGAAAGSDDDVFGGLPAAIQETNDATDPPAGVTEQSGLERSRSLAAVSAGVWPQQTRQLPVFDRLEDWVEDFLRPLYERDLRKLSKTWCAKWWLHPEAYMVLDAMWRAWEYYRHIPGTGLGVWISDYWLKFLPVLTDPDGPFHGCRPDQHDADRESKGIPESTVMPSMGKLERLYEANGRALQLARLKGTHMLFMTTAEVG
jgi:hypothetical protein